MSAESPVAPLIGRVGLAFVAATIVIRTLTNAFRLELDLPGTQLLLDGVALCGAACVALGRSLAGAPVLQAGRAPLLATALAVGVLVVSAFQAPHADLAWRTAISNGALLLLALTARDLGRDPRRARALLAVAVGCVLAASADALWQELVAAPALLAEWKRGELRLPEHSGFRQQLVERIHSKGSAGPFLLPNLLACAVACTLPALLVAAREGWERRKELGTGARSAVLLGLLAAMTLLGGAALQARSKGGFLALLGGLATLALLAPRLDAWRRRVVVGLAGAGALVALVGLAAWAVHPEAEGVGLSLQVRLEYWRAGLAMFAERPLAGVGLNQFRAFYPAFKSLRAEETMHAHNGVVEVLAEAGLLGLGALLGLAWAWGREGVRAAVGAPGQAASGATREEHAADDVALGLGVALGGLLLVAYGDADSLLTPLLQLGLVAVGLGVATRLPAPSPRALAGAALAGVAAFAVDGLTDFGLHFANTALLAALLAGLAPALGALSASPAPDGPLGPPGPRGAAGALLAAGLAAAAVAAMAVALLRGQPADRARETARAALEDANQGADVRANVDLAAEELAAACEAWPWHGRSWLERGALERTRGRPELAQAAFERAQALEPRSAQVRHELGELAAARGDRAAARVALDEAAALYPGSPEHLLAAARVRLAGTPTPADRAEALALLRRTLVASATIRQVSLRLSAESTAEVEQLIASLSTR